MLQKGSNIHVLSKDIKGNIIDINYAVITKVNKNNIKIDINKNSYGLDGVLKFEDGSSEELSEITEEAKELKEVIDYDKKIKILYKSAMERYAYLPKPNRFLNLGDTSSYGKIIDILNDGKFYLVKCGKNKLDINIYPWIHVWLKENNNDFEFGSRDSHRIAFYNQQLQTLLFKAYCQGIDFDVDYQRGYVWEEEDKVELIHSIFTHIEIGKFVFISTPNKYEILDGKQRLTTLLEFYEDKFKYRGKYFSQLSVSDKNHFLGFNVSVGETESLTKIQKLNYFKRLNSKGRVMSKEHLNKIDEMISEEIKYLSLKDLAMELESIIQMGKDWLIENHDRFQGLTTGIEVSFDLDFNKKNDILFLLNKNKEINFAWWEDESVLFIEFLN